LNNTITLGTRLLLWELYLYYFLFVI
jgi:hypothetical protein